MELIVHIDNYNKVLGLTFTTELIHILMYCIGIYATKVYMNWLKHPYCHTSPLIIDLPRLQIYSWLSKIFCFNMAVIYILWNYHFK